MVATVRNLTSASATSEYFQHEGGYYLASGGDREAARAKEAEPLHAMLKAIWAERARELGEVPIVTRSRGRVSLPVVPSALEIVGRAMDHLEERRSVFAERDLEALALGHSPGRYSIEALRDAIAWMVRDGHLVEARLRGTDRAFVTDRALKAERAVIAAMKAGIGAGALLALEAAVAANLAGTGLTEGQEEAIRTILLTPDRIVGVQGRAGAGKTTMLRHVRELAGKRLVVGLAPSTAAARVLERETDMPARTLQWFLARCRAVDPGSESPGSSPGQAGAGGGPVIERLKERFRGAVLVLDEASMVSTDQMKSLMRITKELDIARLVLVGDRSQLRAVEAGQPFRLLQKTGMTTAVMDEILRQRSPALRAAVTAVLEGEPGEAVELLGSSVHEVPWDELGQKAAEAWLELDPETRSRTLLVAPTHELRAEINAAVRDGLAAEGVLRGQALRIERLVGLGMTRAEKADARNYREGDTVVPNQDLMPYRVKRDEALIVTGLKEDRVLLLHPDGRPRHIAPQQGYVRYRLDVYETQAIEIRAGDRIRWTRNDRKRDLVNGEQAEVAAITKDRVRFLRADGHTVSLRHDDPQLRHLDHAWSSTVHGAQGSTADGVIAVLDSGHGALTDQSTFYVEISRARDSAVVLTDNCEQLVEVLEAHTGERATALEATGEVIVPEPVPVPIPDKLPAWSPHEEWAELEEKARHEGTILFRVEGYEGLIGRAQKLVALYPDLPAPVREDVDGLLAYDSGCREGDGGATEFLGLLDAHDERRNALERHADAGDSLVAELEAYPAWREMSERLAANGKALLEDLGEHAGEDGTKIAGRLDGLAEILLVDEAVPLFLEVRQEVRERAEAAGTIPYHAARHDVLLELARALVPHRIVPTRVRRALEEVIAEAEACDRRVAEIAALRDETGRLVGEHGQLETRAGDESPTVLAEWEVWSERSGAAARRWHEIGDDPGTWRPHLDRMREEAAAIDTALDRLGDMRERDEAWADLSAVRLVILEQAGIERLPPFYLGDWDAFVERARAFSEREDLPGAAAALARGILEYDRDCREARGAIDGFLTGEREHRRGWDGLQNEAARARREGEDRNLSMAELPGYGPLSEFARTLRETGEAILDNDNARRYDPHLDRVRNARADIAAALEHLARHRPFERFLPVMDEVARVRGEAEARNILPFHHDDWPEAVDGAEEAAKDPALEAVARRRLQAVLDEHADRAAEWAIVRTLLQDMEELQEEERRLTESAEREGIPVTLLPDWRNWHDASRYFAEDAEAALSDDELRGIGHWRSRPDDEAVLEEGVEKALESRQLPEREDAHVAAMIDEERARLGNVHAEHAFGRRWRVGQFLVEGDRLRIADHPFLPDGEAVVVATGLTGGLTPADELELEWVAPGQARDPPGEDIRAGELANAVVWRADWVHDGLRDAALMRERPRASEDFPYLCNGDVAIGDLLRWTEVAPPELSAEDHHVQTGRPKIVHVEAELVERVAEVSPMADVCVLRETARSDDRPCRQRRSVPLARLTVGGCMRAAWAREEDREAVSLVEDRRLGEERQELRKKGPYLSMRLEPE